MTPTGTDWIKMASFPDAQCISGKPIAINDIEFINWSQKRPMKIHKFNIIKNTWNEWIKLPNDVKGRWIGAMIFGKNADKLYLHCHPQFIEWDIKHKTHRIFDGVLGTLSEGVIINGKCHIIGGMSNKHLIWDNQQNEFDIHHEFEDFNSILLHRLIYLKSKKILLFLGGMNQNDMMNDIYSFDLDTSKWSKLSQTLPNKMCHFGCIQSRNDQYIVIFAGWTKEDVTDKIHVINTKTMTFTESSIICPKKGYFRAINMNNSKKEELLNCGYIRYLWGLPQFNDIMYPPFYLVQIIGNYFSLEMIHLLENLTGTHWKINIDEIISNCSK